MPKILLVLHVFVSPVGFPDVRCRQLRMVGRRLCTLSYTIFQRWFEDVSWNNTEIIL